MPLAFEPGKFVKVQLKVDEGRPDRPTFTARFLTARQARQVRDLKKRIADAEDDDAACPLVVEALGIVLAGWSGVVSADTGLEIPFEPARIVEALSHLEMWELLVRCEVAAALGVNDLKKSESQSPTSSDASAAEAVQPPAPAV